jgi:alkaline phosphatase
VERHGNPGVVTAYRAPDQPLLDEMTEAALKVLSRNRDGFVLMVEGAHIDKQSHLMDAERANWETIEFDQAVARAVEFAKRAGDTLVIVTADHECSGFSIIGASAKTTAELEALPSDVGLVLPGDHPARQAAVGPYEAAGFPSTRSRPTASQRRRCERTSGGCSCASAGAQTVSMTGSPSPCR